MIVVHYQLTIKVFDIIYANLPSSIQLILGNISDSIYIGQPSTAFALTPFLGDNTRFFKNGRRFSNLSASRGRSFCGS